MSPTTISRRSPTPLSFNQISTMLGPLLSSTWRNVVQALPVAAKLFAFLIFIVNARSLPGAWHIRVFRPVFVIRFKYYLVRLSTLFSSRKVKQIVEDQWLDSISPVGADPFNYVVHYNSWASINDCDFNGHLSNSSYAKTMDAARFKTALKMFPMFFTAGGWMPLAATHYHFIKEIPMAAKYEVRVTIAGWDHKWLYVVSKFVTAPKKRSSKSKSASKTSYSKQQNIEPNASQTTSENLFHASVRTPSGVEDMDMGSSSSSPSSYASVSSSKSEEHEDTTRALKAVTANLLLKEEEDGAVLHTVSVSQVCFKIGRITIPPAVAIAINGFSAPPSSFGLPSSSSAYSHANPPPHWSKVKAVMSVPSGGSMNKVRALFRGGWRDIPESERWWDQAMSGVVEEKRQTNLATMEALRYGMEGARAC